MQPVIPMRSMKRRPKHGLARLFDQPKYRQHHIIERIFGWPKKNSHIVTRLDELCDHGGAGLLLAVFAPSIFVHSLGYNSSCSV